MGWAAGLDGAPSALPLTTTLGGASSALPIAESRAAASVAAGAAVGAGCGEPTPSDAAPVPGELPAAVGAAAGGAGSVAVGVGPGGDGSAALAEAATAIAAATAAMPGCGPLTVASPTSSSADMGTGDAMLGVPASVGVAVDRDGVAGWSDDVLGCRECVRFAPTSGEPAGAPSTTRSGGGVVCRPLSGE